MTPHEERLYWIGFGRRATEVLGLTHGGYALAELIKASPNPVRDTSFPSYRTADAHAKKCKPKTVTVLVCHLRGALEDMGVTNAFHRVKGDYGDPGTGGYWMEPGAALAVRALVEGRS